MTRTGSRPDFRAAVWIVEDSRLYRDTLGALIDRSDRLRCAHIFDDGEAALATLRQGDEVPRLILMDIGLPGMGGIECTRQIRAISPSIPVVMLTVHQSNDRIFEAICAGASGYLLKSETSERILSAIETALDGGAAIDAQIARRVLEMFSRLAAGPKVDYGLSPRERQILELLVSGSTKREIGDRLTLSPHTIDGHVRNIYSKLHVNNRSGAVAKALTERII